jgi:hypothetical protein
LGGLSNTAASRTGSQQSTTVGGSTSTSTPNFSPLQTAMQGATGSELTDFIKKGPDLTPAMTAGTDTINTTYKGIGDRLAQGEASRGFGNSGASGTQALQTEVGRAGAVGNLQASLEAQAQAQQLQALQTATGFSFAAPGSTTTSATTGTNSGTYTEPGSVPAGVLSGGLTTLLSQLNAASAAGGIGGSGATTYTGGGYGG